MSFKMVKTVVLDKSIVVYRMGKDSLYSIFLCKIFII